MITRKSGFEIRRMRKAGELVARILNKVVQTVAPGVTTIELDRVAEAEVEKFGVVAAFKGYSGFPAGLCVSVNEEVVHGIPGSRRLKEGDIVGLDFGVIYKGYYGDAALTVPVGNISAKHAKLVRVTREALWEGIKQARAGNHLSVLSGAVQKHVEKHGFSVVREFVGHGIGQSMHEDPQIPNFVVSSKGGYDPVLKPGMTLAIEPMVNCGGYRVKVDPRDRWTVTTKDGTYSAHFEHTVLVTEDVPEILTRVTPEEAGGEELISW